MALILIKKLNTNFVKSRNLARGIIFVKYVWFAQTGQPRLWPLLLNNCGRLIRIKKCRELDLKYEKLNQTRDSYVRRTLECLEFKNVTYI